MVDEPAWTDIEINNCSTFTFSSPQYWLSPAKMVDADAVHRLQGSQRRSSLTLRTTRLVADVIESQPSLKEPLLFPILESASIVFLSFIRFLLQFSDCTTPIVSPFPHVTNLERHGGPSED